MIRYFTYNRDRYDLIKTLYFECCELMVFPIYNIDDLYGILSQSVPIDIALDDADWDTSAISEVNLGIWSNTLFINPNQFKLETGDHDII